MPSNEDFSHIFEDIVCREPHMSKSMKVATGVRHKHHAVFYEKMMVIINQTRQPSIIKYTYDLIAERSTWIAHKLTVNAKTHIVTIPTHNLGK